MVRNVNRHHLVPGMIVEVAADELEVRFPKVESVGGAVHAHKAVPGLDVMNESVLLLVAHRQLARGIEHHRVVVLQILRREA